MNEIKIIMADDHAMIRSGIAHLLTTRHPDIRVVAEASDGKELLAILYQLPDSDVPDVCILDMNMPHMSGPEALPELRRKYPHMAILTLSIYGNEHSILYMLRHGAHGFISKDARTEDLYDAIVTVSRGGYYHPDISDARIRRRISDEQNAELSDKEITFLQYCVTELAYKEIAVAMHVSLRTVHGYRDKLFQKLGCQSRTGLVVFTLNSGIYLPGKKT